MSGVKNDSRPFRDSLFVGNSGAKAFPYMTLEGAGLGGFFNFDPENLEFGALMNQSDVPKKTGWSRLLSTQIRVTRFYNDQAIQPGFADFSSGQVNTFSIGPGIAGQWVRHPWYAGGAGIFAPSLCNSILEGQSQKQNYASFFSLRGSAGYNFGLTAWGANVYQSIMTVDQSSISLTETGSKVEFFYLHRF